MKAAICAMVIASLAGAGAARGSETSEQATLHQQAKLIGTFRTKTWGCQQTLGHERTRASVDVWSLPHSIPYRAWVQNLWKGRASLCLHRLEQRRIGFTDDWLTAVERVQRVYPGTKAWLLYISDREGGWGRFVMNSQGSGAGGWLQFMASTYYAYNDAAFADARRRDFVVPEATNSWTQPLGQALTGAYMRYTGRDGCHWCLG